MEKDIENYFSEFKNTLSKIQVTDGNNKAIDLINGLEDNINLIVSQTSKGNKMQ